MGRLVAEWIVDGQPGLDAWAMDSRRFGSQYRSRSYTLARAEEVYATYYDVKYPGQERTAGRPLRVSPVYERHGELDAVFGEKGGWERVNWFESNAPGGDERLRPGGWAGELWSPAIGAEHLACRARAGLFDETSFAKFEVIGPGSADFLEWMCANRVARSPGTVTYTQLLNQRGGVECDLTVTRLAEQRFRLVTGTAFGTHDLAWIRSHLPEGGSVQVEDVTSRYACLALWGPSSRAILQPLTDTDLSGEAFGYMKARELNVGPVPCLAQRVTFVGELGWELYCPAEFALRLWDLLMEAGRPEGLVPGGYRAIDSMRVEKGYRLWGSDMTSTDTPFEAGVGFAVRMDKAEFIGQKALADAGAARRRLACLVLDDPRAVVLGSEPVRVDGRTVGRVTSGGYGYSVARSVAYAYVPAALADVGRRVEVGIFDRYVGAAIAAEPLFDPTNARVRA
jgi:4-methylaminobutanoate oxidase (formaldehyde-forming)